MNLGDGLKLETELLDGKTKLILSPYEHKSKISVKMGNKTRIAKCPLRTKTGHILKSIGSEKLLQKKTVGSETSQAKGEKNGMTFSSTKDLYKQHIDTDCLHIQKDISPATPNIQKTRNTINTSLVVKQKPHKKHTTAENTKSSSVCLTQDQLQQILMTVNQGNRSLSLTENEKEAKSQYSLHLNSISNQPKDENIMGLFTKTEMVSSVPAENKSILNEYQETSKQCEQKIAIESEWKPADIFSTLGERERDRSLLEAKKAQWRKELDEQVALKKKEKEVSEKWNDPWKKSESDKIIWGKLQILDQSRETVLLEHPFSAVKQELQRKWIEELNKQIESDRQRKLEEKLTYSKGEEHDRWAVHFDSLKSYPGSQSQLSSRSTHKQAEYFCVSPDTQELADVSSVCTPTTGRQVEPSEEEHIAKPIRDVVMANSKKTNFLRSMTALLDPAQIEERDRRRQKQLEHQKAITAQVEEKRRKKQLEEEQRKKEEQEEELRLAREREEMQKQYEEDILKQKQKEVDDLNLGIFTNAESQCGSLTERDITNRSSPEMSAELSTKKNKQELIQDKGANLEKENNRYNDQCNQFTRIQKQTKHMKKCLKRPDWNINKLPKRYIPASEKYPQQLQKQREEKKVRRQIELLHLVEKNNPGHLSQNRGISPEILHSSHQETESKFRWHLVKKEEEPLNINSFSKERSQSSPVPTVKNRSQQTQNTLHLPLKNSSYERENLISGGNQTELPPGISESFHFIPYVRTSEIYYLDPDAPLSRPSTQDSQYQPSQNCGQEQQLLDSDCVRDPLLNPNLVKNRDRQQAILKGLSELRQGLLQKQKELESNLLPITENQEENFGSSF
nr:coiled-coil domain-containing protein 66 isoform X5 [Saimiri boliviensis boliviensis]